jgi:hypothetical protein
MMCYFILSIHYYKESDNKMSPQKKTGIIIYTYLRVVRIIVDHLLNADVSFYSQYGTFLFPQA